MKTRLHSSRMKSFTLLFLLTLNLLFSTNNSSPQSWNAITTGTNGTIYAAVVFNDILYVGGDFTIAGGVTANRIASWNGAMWSPLGTGMDNTVRALTVLGTNIVAGGDFTTAGGNPANYIAQWNGTTWTNFAIGMNGVVHALTVGFTPANLCAGGGFTTAGGNSTLRLARWTGSGWTAIGTGTNDTVYAMVPSPFVSATEIIVGGKFTLTGSSATVNRVGRWNTSTFVSGLGTGISDGAVFALAGYGANLYVGGSYTLIGGNPVSRIAYWNNSSWFNVTSGVNNTVYSLIPSSTVIPGSSLLIIGGLFTTAGSLAANSIATWNGSAWGTLGTGMAGGSPTSVRASRDFRGTLSAEGSFATAGGSAVDNSALWGSIPGAPTPVAPPCLSGGWNPNAITLDWTDVPNAWRYGVQVSTNPNFTSFVVNVSNLAASQYTIPIGLLQNNTTYYWRCNATNALGTGPFSIICVFTTSPVGIIINTNEIPKDFRVYQNYPNPFNPSTVIKFDIPEIENKNFSVIQLSLFDVNGREIAALLKVEYKPGQYEFTFDAGSLPSGAYFYRITAGNFVKTNKMVLMK
jgi:type IX secretion system substrate protein